MVQSGIFAPTRGRILDEFVKLSITFMLQN